MAKKKVMTFSWNHFMERLRNSVFRPKKQVKDIVFRLIFGNNKEALLQLYNALNKTKYTDPNELRIVTLDNAIYISMKNDLAFLLVGTINMYEHQSTVNPNMPVRFMIYLAQEYQMFVESASSSLYGNKLIPLPPPQCVVFYNGTEETPDEYELRLSSAFCNQDVKPAAEVIVRVVNINYGHNEYLMQGCELMSQYAEFVEITREYALLYDDREEAMNAAIDYCIAHGILEDILRKHRSQILGSLLEDFDEKKYAKTLREEGREEGWEAGLQAGRESGLRDGREAGLQDGRQEGRQEMAKAIARQLNLSVEEVLKMGADENT
ncbi:MAG: hypothetical protein IIX48_04165 [Lachnospiraceae bacterium]|nr:hypothetical protein [Lachnospiraceae bacterium]